MPFPSSTLSTQRPDIANGFEEFSLEANRSGYVGTRVMPVLEVGAQAGVFGILPIEQLLQNPETVRGNRGGYNRGDWEFETDTYSTVEHGWEEVIDKREAKMYGSYFDFEMIAAARARNAVLQSMEQRISAATFNATTWTGAALTTAITHEWDDATNAVPITDVEAAVRKIADNAGLWANALIINRYVFRNLREVAQIQDRITSVGAGDPIKATDITTQMLSAVFDLPYIIVADGFKNTAKKGQDASLSQNWSPEYAMVARIAETNDFREPCLGRTFHWGEDGSEIGGATESYYSEEVRADIIRVRNDTHEKVLYAKAGHLLSNVTT